MAWTAERHVPPREPVHVAPSAQPLAFRTRAAIVLGRWLLHALGATWRVRVHGRQPLLDRTAADPRVVYTLWHGQMLPILWAHRQRTGVMISEHKDGEIIAQIVGAFGFFGVRGSTSRGAARVLMEAVRALHDGADIAITPDGPRGPRHRFAQGALVLAHRAGAPVVPIVAHVARAWRLGSWDGFEIPKPFARITILYDTSTTVNDVDARAAAARTGEFASRMQQALDRAAALAATD